MLEIPSDATQEYGDPYPDVSERLCDAATTDLEYDGTKPVLFGHYWRTWPPTSIADWTPKAACVDFSAAKGGPLAAYRWDGEDTLSDDKYVGFPEVEDLSVNRL